MLNREQSVALLMAYNRVRDIDHPLGSLPREVAMYIMNIAYNPDPDSGIAIALRLAADGQEKAIEALEKMIEENPSLLLQAGDVVSRGGVPASRKTLIAFFLSEGDPIGAKRIEFGFEKIPDGKKIHEFQYKEYEPHIKALKKQIESKIPTFNLIPLFDALIKSTPLDITEALKKETDHKSGLSEAMQEFITALKLKRNAVMHYEHYTTLMQAFDLRFKRWAELSNNYSNYDKCDFLWGRIIWPLQYNLPAIDRFPFARAFDDEERTVDFKYGNGGTFPDAQVNAGPDFIEGDFGFAIYGRPGRAIAGGGCLGRAAPRGLENTCRTKASLLETLCSNNQPINQPRPTGV